MLWNCISKYPKRKALNDCQCLRDYTQALLFNVKNWFCKYDRLNRLWLLLLSFEIYLTWVTEESKYIYYLNRNNNDGKLIMLSKNYQRASNGTRQSCAIPLQVKCLPGAHQYNIFTLQVIVFLTFLYSTPLPSISY